jgi:hypothetical protein
LPPPGALKTPAVFHVPPPPYVLGWVTTPQPCPPNPPLSLSLLPSFRRPRARSKSRCPPPTYLKSPGYILFPCPLTHCEQFLPTLCPPIPLLPLPPPPGFVLKSHGPRLPPLGALKIPLSIIFCPLLTSWVRYKSHNLACLLANCEQYPTVVCLPPLPSLPSYSLSRRPRVRS